MNFKVIRIGNSRGVRLPTLLLSRYRIKGEVLAELRPEGILLKSVKDDRVTWAETAQAMAEEGEQEFTGLEEAVAGDGLESSDR